MNRNEPFELEDRTIDLALNLLSAEEEVETLAAIAKDRVAEEDLIGLIAVRESIQAEPAPNVFLRSSKQGRKLRKRRLPIPYVLVAATIAFFAIRLFWIEDTLPLIAPIQVPSEANRLRGMDGMDGNLERGLAAYESGDYEEAERLLSDATAFGATDTMRLIYLASTHNQTGRYEDAIAILEVLPFETIPDPWGSEGVRNLVHALREGGEDDRADSILERYGHLLSNGETPNSTREK